MTDLDDLARQYNACVRSDGAGFRRKARVLQSIWREERGYPTGLHRGRPLGSRLEMPWARETLNNYLTDTIRAVVRHEVIDSSRSAGKLYARPRIFNDLLSSQPLCFNLFAELQQDLDLASAVFRKLTAGRSAEVTDIDFEHSPGRGDLRYTGDSSAFDVYVTFTTPEGGRGFVGIEVKYHENLQGRPARHRTRYDDVAEAMGCFRPEASSRLRQQPLQQIWRDHLLAGAHLQADDFADGLFAFLYPQDNSHCSKAIEAYRGCLSNELTLAVWTLESVLEIIRQYTAADWSSHFFDRYLNFAKLGDASKAS